MLTFPKEEAQGLGKGRVHCECSPCVSAPPVGRALERGWAEWGVYDPPEASSQAAASLHSRTGMGVGE